jgi:DNA-binding NarL/FixJ family response regulator
MGSPQIVTLLLIENHAMVRSGLAALLSSQDAMRVVGQAGDGRAGVDLAAELRPDVALVNVQLPELNGIEATRQIRAASPRTKVLGLAGTTDRKAVTAMLQAGASGYIAKHSEPEELLRAILAIRDGQTYLGPRIADAVIQEVIQPTALEEGRADGLSPRQCEVLQLLAEGKTTKQVAMALDVSPKTIETHRKNLMDKLGLYTIADLTRYAIREGITPLDM